MDFEANILADIPTIGDIRKKEGQKTQVFMDVWTFWIEICIDTPLSVGDTRNVSNIFSDEIYSFVFRLRGMVLRHEIWRKDHENKCFLQHRHLYHNMHAAQC